jgi:hypothetical protein
MMSHSATIETSAKRLTLQRKSTVMTATIAINKNVRGKATDPTAPAERAKFGEYGRSPGTHSAM